jgi:hypothetical protein
MVTPMGTPLMVPLEGAAASPDIQLGDFIGYEQVL